MRTLTVLKATFLLATSLLCSTHAFAWGSEGHRIVGDIATELLSPKARAGVRDLVGSDNLALIATWADTERLSLKHTYPHSEKWHYLNWPICSDAPYAQFCPNGDCVVDQIKNQYKVLHNTGLDKSERADALRFLVHFVGDIHQPLHVSDNNDRGGNQVEVQVIGARGREMSRNLHEVWDTEYLKQQVRGHQEEAFAHDLLVAGKAEVQSLQGGSAEDWAKESHLLSRKYAYAFASSTLTCGRSPNQAVELNDEYHERAIKVIDHQLLAAGVRLAAILNAEFDSK